MSIKSLFENIADAIKDKNPNIANVTPVEMPSAIRSIPSGSSTAGGVTYDNTASGLTANNVQDAIDELAEDVSTINSDLSELLTWQLLDEPKTGKYTFELPSDYTEIYVIAKWGSSVNTLLPKSVLANNNSYFFGCGGSSNNIFVRLDYTVVNDVEYLQFIKLEVNGTDRTSASTITVYYR